MLNNYIDRTVCSDHFVRQLQRGKPAMLVGISGCDPPSSAPLYPAVVDVKAIVSGNSRPALVGRRQGAGVNAAVVQMLVIYIPVYIVDIQVIQLNPVKGSSVLCHNADACPVHQIPLVVHLSFPEGAVGDLNVPHRDVLRIVEKHCR